MTAYKLVVVSPFENYKRGDTIFDQNVINKILDEKDEMHGYDRHVRRVALSAAEKQMYVAPIPANEAPKQNNVNDDASIHLSSVKPKIDESN